MLYAYAIRYASRCSLRLLSYRIMSLSYNISYTYTHIISYCITCYQHVYVCVTLCHAMSYVNTIYILSYGTRAGTRPVLMSVRICIHVYACTTQILNSILGTITPRRTKSRNVLRLCYFESGGGLIQIRFPFKNNSLKIGVTPYLYICNNIFSQCIILYTKRSIMRTI